MFAATRLRMELDRVPLWRGDHVPVKQLVEDFARYLYLPRLKDSSVLTTAIGEGVSLLTWENDAFGFADSYDDGASRYRGLRAGQVLTSIDAHSPALLVKPEVARKQFDAEAAAQSPMALPQGPTNGPSSPAGPRSDPTPQPLQTQPKRFYGTVTLDTARVGRDASNIAENVIAHLSALVGADVTVTLEIAARVPSGVPDNVVRTVTENSRTLKFTAQGFEQE